MRLSRLELYLKTIIITGLISCAKRGEAPSQPLSIESLDRIEDKRALYLSLSSSVQDSDGFIETDSCDSLLFSSLYGVGGGILNIGAARDDVGQWYRRPLSYTECFESKGSTSTISRDMLLGVMWYAWQYRRLDIATDLFNYGVTHTWVMGKGDPSRTLFTPEMQATLAELVFQLGGSNHNIYRVIPQIYAKNNGFEAHLDILTILLRAEMTGSISNSALNTLSFQYNRNSKNALYAYAWHRYSDGNQQETVDLLLNEAWFPADRLPTSNDRCEGWLFQRDIDRGWQPCNEGKTHSGGDFLFVSKLLISRG